MSQSFFNAMLCGPGCSSSGLSSHSLFSARWFQRRKCPWDAEATSSRPGVVGGSFSVEDWVMSHSQAWVCTFVCVFVCVYVCAYMCVHVCMEARVWCWMSLLIVLHHIYWGRVSYFNPDLTYLASLKLLWGPLPACPQVLDSRKVPKLLAFICVLEIQTPVHHIHRVISSAPRIFFKRKASLVHYIYGPWVSVEMQILESE